MEKYSVLIIGGYGNFGKYIAKVLCQDPRIELAILGRDRQKAEDLVKTLNSANPITIHTRDIFQNPEDTLKQINPYVVIHTSGPFQSQDYAVAKACLSQACHYIDLADSRHFVSNITELHHEAQQKGVLICSGASSVPGLSSAIIEHFLPQFSQLDSVDYAIATAQLTNQGLATTAGVLTYAGKPFKTMLNGIESTIYGWQNIRLVEFWRLHHRFLGNCDIPDLELFPKYYQSLKTIRFQAGLELKGLQIILFLLSWLVRLKLLPALDNFANPMLKISHLLDRFGSNNTGFYMTLKGQDKQKKALNIRFDIHAQDGDGLYIPCTPAIILTELLINQQLEFRGAMPCVGLISLDNYLNRLKELNLNITWNTTFLN
ncbi:saccharopine dehydrogenase family protein [Legionella waltersii]|uniref:Saccharopine dehydrogenase n=1 Tax=Legionella waltersii TaxID=66969 RepID=A0A0W1ADI0_9GAMM|nr:saccharopine dehydrogenase NADP-binding domain-containing protein [Legionella waltersii]KTD79387.1 Saccharopine dehydrogenase [Legionella waltersii]SNU99645.1 Saccharopine dehydrogenase [Legionella waltersii]